MFVKLLLISDKKKKNDLFLSLVTIIQQLKYVYCIMYKLYIIFMYVISRIPDRYKVNA